MRVLYALDSYRPNIDGVGVTIERQAAGLVKRGHQAALVAPAYSSRDYEELRDDIRILRMRSATLIRPQWRLAVMPSEIIDTAFDDFRPDVAVVSVPFPIGLRVLRAARRRGLPVVGITGTMPEWLLYSLGWLRPVLANFYDRLWNMLVTFYNRCDFVVGVSFTALRYLERHGLTRPSGVISNGVDLQDFRPRSPDDALRVELNLPNKPSVLYTGRLDPEKRVDVLVEAIPLVAAQADAHFVIGGDGSEKERLRSEVAKLGVEDRVTFTGFLSADHYRRIYSLAEVFVMPSPAELQSVVTLEAAASGLPIVGVNAGALPELVQKGRNGFLFGDGDPLDLARQLVALLAEPQRASWMGLQSRAIARHHDIRQTISRYERLYQAIISQSATPRWRSA